MTRQLPFALAALLLACAPRREAPATAHADSARTDLAPVISTSDSSLQPTPSAVGRVAEAASVPSSLRDSAAVLRWIAEDPADGSRFLWVTIRTVPLPYEYRRTADFPGAPEFVEVARPRPGDVVWWPAFMAVYGPTPGTLVTSEGEEDFARYEARYGGAGEAHFFRYRVRRDEHEPARR